MKPPPSPFRKYSREARDRGALSQRSRSQPRSEEELDPSINNSFELDKKSSPFSPSLQAKSSSPERELDDQESPPNSAFFRRENPFILDNLSETGEDRGLQRSQTMKLALGSPSIFKSRRESKRLSNKAETRFNKSPDSHTLHALREKVAKIKELQTFIKGCDVLKTNAEMIDSFSEFSSGRNTFYMEQYGNNFYYRGSCGI